MWALYVWPLYVNTVWEHSLCEHSMCDHSMWALYVWPLYMSTLYVWPVYVNTVWEHSLCEHSMCDHPMWALYVWPLYMGTPKSTKITRKNEQQFLGRMLQNTEKYENYQETSTSVLGSDVAAPKTSKKPEFYCKNTGQEHWRTPKSTRITTKNEHRRSWRGKKVRKFTDETRFRPFQEHRRHEKYENYQEKRTSKKLKSRKPWKFTDKTRSRRSEPPANYENSHTKRTCKHETTKIGDEIRPTPVRHLDLATPAFTITVRTPSVTTLFGETPVFFQGKNVLNESLTLASQITKSGIKSAKMEKLRNYSEMNAPFRSMSQPRGDDLWSTY